MRWGVDRQTQKFKGFCHIEFASADAVPLAVSKTGTDVCGRNIRVSAARGPSNGKGGNVAKSLVSVYTRRTTELWAWVSRVTAMAEGSCLIKNMLSTVAMLHHRPVFPGPNKKKVYILSLF